MRRFCIALVLVSGCAPPDALSFFMPDGWVPQSVSDGEGGGGAGGSAPTGDGGAGGEGATSTTSASGDGSGGSGGSGGQGCTPKENPCGSSCGSVDDGCGNQVECGCASGEVCVASQCCAPRTACGPGMCGLQEDGCGGFIGCPYQCGDGTEMQCAQTGTMSGVCECRSLADGPNGAALERQCANLGGLHPYACGSNEAPWPADRATPPAGCVWTGWGSYPGGPDLWCCP